MLGGRKWMKERDDDAAALVGDRRQGDDFRRLRSVVVCERYVEGWQCKVCSPSKKEARNRKFGIEIERPEGCLRFNYIVH